MAPIHHLLQVSDVLDIEFASALAETVPVIGWEPQRSLFPGRVAFGDETERLYSENPALRLRSLPLMRGFARPPISWFARTGPAVLERLLRQTPEPAVSPLICSVPYFAWVAERWPGPVVYWLTDLIAAYSSADHRQVEALDRRMCDAATLVCPNSQRIAAYFVDRCGCEPGKIHVLPNATRAMNLLPKVPQRPMPRPQVISTVRRPIAGIIGNLAGNLDWLLLERLIDLTPYLSWVFVGPTTMRIVDRAARKARAAVMAKPRAHFVPRQPYGDLAAFARCFDVAVLPYLRCEPTYSGSSTRFYEHLAACRPMIATRGLEELNRKVPLLTLIDTAEEAAEALEALRDLDFDDGFLRLRWEASRNATWQARAQSMRRALAQRLASPARPSSPAVDIRRIA